MGERIAHIITKGKNKERPQNVIYCDSESRPNPDTLVHEPYLMCAYFCRYKKRNTEYKKDYPNNVKEFWQDACDFAQFKTTTYIYAHNMGYDMIATAAIPVLEKNYFRLKSFFQKGGTLIYKFVHVELDCELEPIEGKTKTITLLSTTNFYADKLKNIAPVFGLEKIDIEAKYGADYNNIPMEESTEYCYQDVLIIKVAMEALFEFINREDLGVVGKTAASQAFNAFRHRFMEEEIFIHTNINSLLLERAGYYGGRVECWHIGELKDNEFYYVDVNSMYPYVMANYNYPVKLLSYRKHNTLAKIKAAIEYGDGVIAKVKIKTSFPYFPKRTATKLIFPVGEFYTTLATPELKFAIEHNLITAIYEASYYEMKPLFKPFIDYFYTKRLEAKAAKDKIHDYLYKLMMNCLYGKFGQLAENWELVGDAEYGIVRHETIIDYDTGEITEVRIMGGTVFKKIGADESFNSFPAIAAHVTSQARIHLLEHILIAKPENVLYMDTDSLFINEQGHDNLLPALNDKLLGKMKLEGYGSYVRINAPKDYVFKGIIKGKPDTIKKTKGISADARGLTFYEFLEYIEKQRKKIPNKEKFAAWLVTIKKEELTLNTQWPKLTTFLNEGQLSQFHNIKRVKWLNRKYNKGIVLKDGRVIPFEMHE